MSNWDNYKETMVLESDLYELARTGKSDQLLPMIMTQDDLDQKNVKGHSLLMLAAYNGHFELSCSLVKKGADLDSRDLSSNTILMGLAFKGHFEILKYMVESGADFKAINNSNQSALDFALMFGRRDIAEYLSQLKKEKYKPLTGFFKSWFSFVNSNKGA